MKTKQWPDEVLRDNHTSDEHERCFACNKKLTSKVMYAVHLIAGGNTILHPDDENSYVPDGGDVGCWMLGPECAKRLGLEWLTKVFRS